MASAMAQALAGWSALLAGMVLSFLYSGLETGIYTVNKIRLDLRAESGHRAAKRLLGLLRDPSRPLVVLLIGNNLANYLASAGLVLILTARGMGRADWYSVAILTPLVFTFCELLPKNLFRRHGETLTYFFGWFLELWLWVFTAVGLVGLVRILVWVTLKLAGRPSTGDENSPFGSEHLATVLAEGQASGVITGTQSRIAERVVNLSRVHVGDVMVPLSRAAMVEKDATVEDVRRVLGATGHPRLGVYSGRRENLIGVLNAYDVLFDESGAAPATHITPALELHEHTGIIEALVTMQAQRKNIAFVFSDDRRCLGLLTVKDLVEEIVGDLKEW